MLKLAGIETDRYFECFAEGGLENLAERVLNDSLNFGMQHSKSIREKEYKALQSIHYIQHLERYSIVSSDFRILEPLFIHLFNVFLSRRCLVVKGIVCH